MTQCSDPFLKELKERGYNLVLLPKAGIAPLELLIQVGNTSHPIGPLVDMMSAGEGMPLPAPKKNIPCLDIECRYTGQVNAGLGLHILQGFLTASGVPSGALDAQYKQAKSLVFAFHTILQDKVEIIQLDNYIKSAIIKKSSPNTHDLLTADKLYIITSVIKSQNISVEARDASGGYLALGTDQLQGIVGGNVAVSAQSRASTKIIYDNKVPLVFGFQAIQIGYDRGNYHLARTFAPSKYSMRGGENSGNPQHPWPELQFYVSESPFVRIK